MATETLAQTHSPAILDHHLNRIFPELLKFESTAAMEKSSAYQRVKAEVERIINAVVSENFSEKTSENAEKSATVHALAWNVERGCRYEGIEDALENHPQLKDKDLLLLTELDYGMARSGNRFVAQDLARKLKLNYAFAPVYIALQKGSGVESFVEGENTKSLHGLGIFSKYPMKNVHAIPFPNGKDKMQGKEKRLGHLRGLIADVEHPAGTFRAVCIHLDVHCSRKHRVQQMHILLEHLETLPKLPTIIGGDWNTTTFNAQSSFRAILGFWRKIAIGTRKTVREHYPYPDRYFEKGIFDELAKHGFSYKEFNEEGVGTLHYDMDNIAYNTNLADWVPAWCFHFIFWASKKVGGRFSLRLDWFAGRGIEAKSKPQTVGNLRDAEKPLSDHDAITLDFAIAKR